MKTNNTAIDKSTGQPITEEKLLDWFDTKGGREYISQKISEELEKVSPEKASCLVDHPIPSKRMKALFLSNIRQDNRKRHSFSWLHIAAIVIPFMLLTGALAFFAKRSGAFSSVEYAEIKVPYGEHIQVALQDGSFAVLNSGSELRYPKTFSLFSREVKLSGEGYFSISKDKSRPFIIDLNGVDVRVTGTQFNVKAYPDENTIFVTLTEGNVYLQDRFNKKYDLIPGETAKYDRKSAACLISGTKDESAILAWRSNSLNFYRTPLRDIIQVLERQYNVRFLTSDKTILNNRFTISTNQKQVEEILKDLEKVSRIYFIPDGKGNFRITNIP